MTLIAGPCDSTIARRRENPSAGEEFGQGDRLGQVVGGGDAITSASLRSSSTMSTRTKQEWYRYMRRVQS
jgi:hypothetical protein